MTSIVFFYRKKNPAFFSIEQVFQRIAAGLSEAHASEFAVSQLLMPQFSQLQHLRSNMRFTRSHQGDINHVTGDVNYALLSCSRKKVNILTVHDCGLLHQLRRTDPRYWVIKWVWHVLPVRKADVVTAISETTKKDLIRFTGCPPEKIRVIPNFIDPAFVPAPAPVWTGEPRVLFVGTTANKNLERLVAAIEGLSLSLDIIGPLTDDQTAVLKKHGIRYTQSSGLTREQLLQHYRDCHVLAFPSTFEGFGLPVIEAQATGRPVLTSNIAPMKDIAGDAASLVDPYDVASIRAGMMRILNEPEYREKLVLEGLDNAKKYSLRAVVDQYAALYHEFLKKDGIH